MEKYKFDVDQTILLIDAILKNETKPDIHHLTELINGSGDVEVEWNPSALGRARLTISGSEADIEEICVRVSTYRPSNLPISSFARLVVNTNIHEASEAQRGNIQPIKVEALFGIAVGELVTRIDGNISGEWISYGRLSRTFAYCYAQLNYQSHKIQLEEVWERWRDARRMLGNEDPIELESEIFSCIGLIEQATRAKNIRSSSDLLKVLSAENPNAEILYILQLHSPDMKDYLLEFESTLENRMRGFDKCVQIIQKLQSELIEKSIFIAALANLILPGSGTYFHVLRPLAQYFPGLFVWYGYLSGIEVGSRFAENIAPVFRKFVDVVEAPKFDATLKANVDYCELKVMHKAREVTALRRVTEGSFVVIDLNQGLLAQVPFAARLEGKEEQDTSDLVPRSHVEKLLGEVDKILKLGARMGYSTLSHNRNSESKSKRHPAKSKASKAKSVKESDNLF